MAGVLLFGLQTIDEIARGESGVRFAEACVDDAVDVDSDPVEERAVCLSSSFRPGLSVDGLRVGEGAQSTIEILDDLVGGGVGCVEGCVCLSDLTRNALLLGRDLLDRQCVLVVKLEELVSFSLKPRDSAVLWRFGSERGRVGD